MAFTITCPDCSAKLRTATAVPIGRAVKCPKCQFSFAVDKRNIAETSDSKTDITASNGAPKSSTRNAAVSKGSSADSPARSRRRDKDGEDDDRPRSRRRDEGEEDDRPRKKRRDEDDEDDRPRSRRRDDDDEEDRPRKKRRDEGDEDDRPRARSRKVDDDDDRPKRHRDEDDEDDDDRPRRPKKKKKRKKGGGATILIISIVSVLLLVGGGLLLYFLVFAGGYDTEMVALMPADVNDLDFEDIAKLMDHPKAKKRAEKIADNGPLKTAGLAAADIKSRLVGHTEKGGNVTVYRLKNSFDKNKMTSGAEEAKAGEKQYWKLGKKNDFGRNFVSFPADDLIVLTSNEDTMKNVLNKEAGKVVISEELQNLAKKVGDGDEWSAHVRKGGTGGINIDAMEDGPKAMMKAKGSAHRVNISGNTASFVNYTLFASSDDAKKAAEYMKANKEKGLENLDKAIGLSEAKKDAIRKMRQGATISQSGETVEDSSSLDLTPFEDGDKAFF